MYDSVSQMEPMFPSKRAERLADLSVELVRKSAALGGYFRSHTREALVALLRQMNSYYSKLIEGHHTHPIDIERAMHSTSTGTSQQSAPSSLKAKHTLTSNNWSRIGSMNSLNSTLLCLVLPVVPEVVQPPYFNLRVDYTKT